MGRGKMYCVTVSEWKLLQKRLAFLENIVKALTSKSKSKLFGNENNNLNSILDTDDSNEPETVQLNNTETNVVPTCLPGLSSTLTSEVRASNVIHPSSSCIPNGIGIIDQNAFEKSRRAIVLLKTCERTEVVGEKNSVGLRKRNKKTIRKSSVKSASAPPANVPKRNGNFNGSEVGEKPKEKRYKCLLCTKIFAGHCGLSYHTKAHTGEKPYPCRVCAKEFTCNSSLKVHLRLHTGERPYGCHFCPKVFNTNSDLTTHGRVHTREKPYQCQLCTKTFSQLTSLKFHTGTHTGEKPYSCQYCPKTYRRVRNLTNHLRIHAGCEPT